jgi:hypothetical protein
MTTSITCPLCGMTSYNPNDVRENYCGNCHNWIPPKTCMIFGCDRPARGELDAVDMGGWSVPAHFCRYCHQHRCELEIFLSRRHAR